MSCLSYTQAATIDELEDTLKEYSIGYQDKNYLGNQFEIDISDLAESLQENFGDIQLEYVWEVFSRDPQTGTKLSTTFDTLWEKAIELNIFTPITSESGDEEKRLIYSSDLSVFVYKESLPLLISKNVDEEALLDYIDAAEDLWVYVYQIWNISEWELSWEKIIDSLNTYKLSFPENSNYLAIWWEKEFLFSALSQIRVENLDTSSINVVLISAYNTSILRNYIANSIAGKDFIKNGFIIDESLRFQTLKNPQKIMDLEKEVETNNYSYTPIIENTTIAPAFFISKFVNDLSNNWVNLSDIYIILLLPLFLTIVWIAKHLIWLSTLWSIIPVFITLLYIQVWIPFTLWLMCFLIVCNILISRFISKYTLLYTPKVTFITIINVLVFILFYQALQYFNILSININNILYIILFFIVAEKLITIITSKEFREYKKSLTGTLIVSLICYLIYNINSILVFLMAYPELIIVLVPINFLLGRFTWLRITEYLRFREIVKSIEE